MREIPINTTEQKSPEQQKKEKLIAQINEIYAEGTRFPLDEGFIAILIEKRPEIVESILEATEDLRMVASKVKERAMEKLHSLQDDGIELFEMSGPIGQFRTAEGIKKSKLDGPNPFENIGAYKKFIEEQQNKTGYEGLTQEQRNTLLAGNIEYSRAEMYMFDAMLAQYELVSSYGIELENEEQREKDPEHNKDDFFDKATKPLHAIIQPIGRQYTFLKARIDGKLAKLRDMPDVASEKVTDVKEQITNAVKEAWEKARDLFRKEKGVDGK